MKDDNVLGRLLANEENCSSIGTDYCILESPTSDLLNLLLQDIHHTIILYCSQGQIDLTLDMTHISIEQGYVGYFMSGQMVETTYVSENCRMIVLLLSQRFVKQQNLTVLPMGPKLQIIKASSHGSFEKYIYICQDIIRLDPNPEKKEVIRLLTKAYLLAVSHFGRIVDTLFSSNTRGSSITQQFYKLLQDNHTTHHDLSFYSDSLAVTPKYLSSVVKKETTKNAMYWINHMVTITAKHMLTNTDCTIDSISEKLHFSSQKVFGRFFKQQTGSTPSQFRKAQNKALLRRLNDA